VGLIPITLWTACLIAVRNQRILTIYQARQNKDAHRTAAGKPPRTRKRRHHTTDAILPQGRSNSSAAIPAVHRSQCQYSRR
jgi:hypothetical protein